jgi:hypothetical protein
MVRLAYMDGVWRGPAWIILPSGEKHTITQTDRIGPFLDGSVKVIEGRGYDPDGKVIQRFRHHFLQPGDKGLHAALTCDGQRRRFRADPHTRWLHMGHPAGPMTIHYTAVIKDGAWREVGDRIVPGKETLSTSSR